MSNLRITQVFMSLFVISMTSRVHAYKLHLKTEQELILSNNWRNETLPLGRDTHEQISSKESHMEKPEYEIGAYPKQKDKNRFFNETLQGNKMRESSTVSDTEDLISPRPKRSLGKEWSVSAKEARELLEVYYKCLVERLKLMKQPEFSIKPLITHVGQRVEMKCLICFRPDGDPNAHAVSWQFLQRTDSTLRVLDTNSKQRITKQWTLVIKEVTLTDVGQYFCTENDEYIAVYQLDVLTTERRKIITENATSELAPIKILAKSNLELFTSWTEWSQCNLCDKPGHRRKIGLCMVKKFEKGKPIQPVDFPLMEYYTNGVPCRSTALPRSLARLPAIRTRHSEVLLGACNVSCPTLPPPINVTDPSGRVVEMILPGYYSVRDKPKLPPVIKRKVQYREAGMHLVLKCPHDKDEKKDVIISWQRGRRKIDPRTIRRQTRGRVFVDRLNRLNIRKLLIGDTAPYNCWNQKRHVATIKVIVIEKFNANIKDYISYGGFILTAVAVLMTCLCVCCRRGQTTGR